VGFGVTGQKESGGGAEVVIRRGRRCRPPELVSEFIYVLEECASDALYRQLLPVVERVGCTHGN